MPKTDTIELARTPEAALFEEVVKDRMYVGLKEYAQLERISLERARGRRKGGTLGVAVRQLKPSGAIRFNTAELRKFYGF